MYKLTSPSFFLGYLLMALPLVSTSEIIRDTTTGIGSPTVSSDNNTYTITQEMGDTLGETLLHSFTVFTVDINETVNFTGNDAIKNIISRVTGDQLSTIRGNVNSLIEGANFYFINPNGIIIGPAGSINLLGGDLHLSTANQLHFDNGSILYVDKNLALPSSITTASIESFGFLNQDAGDISIIDNFDLSPDASVRDRPGKLGNVKDIVLHANDIHIDNSTLASNNQISMTANRVTLNNNAYIKADGNAASLDIQSQTEINLNDSVISIYNLSNEKGKVSLIAEGDIHLDDSDIFSQNSENAISSDIYIESRNGNFSMASPDISAIVTRANNSGATTNIEIKANNVDLRDGARIQNLQGFIESPKQDIGNITITAKDRFSMSGFSNSNDDRTILQTTNNKIPGNGGDITVIAGDIDIQDRGNIVAGGQGTGNSGGDIQLIATTGDVTISNRDNSNIGTSGSLILTNGANGAQAGDIIISAENNVNLLDQTFISAGSIARNIKGGKAGNVSIDAGNTILLAGKNDNNNNPDGSVERDYRGTRIQAQASNGTDADAGNISLNARHVELRDEAIILNNSTFGNGGDISVDARETLDFTDSLLLTSTRLLENDESGAGGNGDAGNIALSANNMRLDKVNIESKSVSGNGGDITFDVDNTFIATDKTLISTEADSGTGGDITFKRGDLSTSPKPNALIVINSDIRSRIIEGSGDGGHISFEADTMVLKDATISADTDAGVAGDISFDRVKPLVRLGNNSITVNSEEQGTPGAILESELTITEENLVLSEQFLVSEFVNASDLIRQRCSTHQTTDQFTILQQPGVAASPEGLLPSIDPIAIQVTTSVNSSSGQIAQKQGATTFRNGQLDTSKLHWNEAVTYYAATGEAGLQNDALRGTAQVQQAQGDYNASIATLAQAVDIARHGGDQKRLAESLGSLGNALIASGKPGSAQEILEKAVQIAVETQNPSLSARLRNNLGNYYSIHNKPLEAFDHYLQSAKDSLETNQHISAAKAYANVARLHVNALNAADAFHSLSQAEVLMPVLEPNLEKANLHIHLATSYRLLADSRISFDTSLKKAYDHLQRAKRISQQTNNDRLLSYALGNLGGLYQTEKRVTEALVLTRKARSIAEKTNASESLYRWHWQEGQLLYEQGQTQAAIDAYKRAITIIEDSRQTTLARYESADLYFKQQVQPVYRELADILITTSIDNGNDEFVQQRLRDTRDIIEQLKTAELENYFYDDCIATFETKRKNLDDISPEAAIVYPILLQDRLELLVSLPSISNPYQRRLVRYESPVNTEILSDTINTFRANIEGFSDHIELQKQSQPLYDWLIQPYEKALESHRVNTLVFVPDGALRTLPIAALHNGDQYLVEKFSLAVTTGLALTDPRPIASVENKILLAGVSKAINNFPALDAVPYELGAVQDLFDSDVLLDNEFTMDAFTNKIKNKNYSIIHIASHAQFTGDNSNSFLQAHDQPLFMDNLKSTLGTTKYREQPLEMLVLSACQTASGDDRAALGLAGIGIKAGARSAMGSLWNIGDESAATLVENFYIELQKNKRSKAEALRQAQLSLLETKQYYHPAHWGAFMLIDNWL